MSGDRAEHLVESLIVEVELLGLSGYGARDLIVGLLAAAVEVADRAGIPAAFVERMAGRVVEAGGGA